MSKSALPLIALAGGAALLMGGKKKKKSSSSGGTNPTYDDLPSGDPDPYIPPSPAPKPKAPDRPAGNPPRGDSYDDAYWGSTTEERLTKIRQFFANLGYPVEVGAWPMNKLGPKGGLELENKDGTTGKLGGDDDEPNAIVRQFQNDYNRVSRLNKAEKVYNQSMGGLDKDGLVGPYTLNALRYAHDDKPGDKAWPDLIQMADLKGIS